MKACRSQCRKDFMPRCTLQKSPIMYQTNYISILEPNQKPFGRRLEWTSINCLKKLSDRFQGRNRSDSHFQGRSTLLSSLAQGFDDPDERLFRRGASPTASRLVPHSSSDGPRLGCSSTLRARIRRRPSAFEFTTGVPPVCRRTFVPLEHLMSVGTWGLGLSSVIYYWYHWYIKWDTVPLRTFSRSKQPLCTMQESGALHCSTFIHILLESYSFTKTRLATVGVRRNVAFPVLRSDHRHRAIGWCARCFGPGHSRVLPSPASPPTRPGSLLGRSIVMASILSRSIYARPRSRVAGPSDPMAGVGQRSRTVRRGRSCHQRQPTDNSLMQRAASHTLCMTTSLPFMWPTRASWLQGLHGPST